MEVGNPRKSNAMYYEIFRPVGDMFSSPASSTWVKGRSCSV